MYDFHFVEVSGVLNGVSISKFVSTQKDGFIAVNDLNKMGCVDISYSFDDMDSLPLYIDEYNRGVYR